MLAVKRGGAGGGKYYLTHAQGCEIRTIQIDLFRHVEFQGLLLAREGA